MCFFGLSQAVVNGLPARNKFCSLHQTMAVFAQYQDSRRIRRMPFDSALFDKALPRKVANIALHL